MRYDITIFCTATAAIVPLSIAIIGQSAVKAISSNPEAKDVISIAIISMAFCESIALFCFGYILTVLHA